MKTAITLIPVFFASLLLHTQHVHACLPPPGSVNYLSASEQKPTCFITPRIGEPATFENQCERPLSVKTKDCENCYPDTFEQSDKYPDIFDPYELYFGDPPSEKTYIFTLGKPDVNVEQAFDDEQANSSFEVTVRFNPPDEAELDWLEECERALEKNHNSDMPSSPMDMGSDMSLTDMSDMPSPPLDMNSDMPSSGSNQNDENGQGCNIVKQRPHQHFGWFVVLGILLTLRKKRE